jgi:hypothetical protein
MLASKCCRCFSYFTHLLTRSPLIILHIFITYIFLQLRAFPFPLHDEEHDLHSFDAAVVGAAATKAALAVSSARSVSATLYPEGMHAILQHAATKAAAASEAAKLRAAADANRLAASIAAFKVVDSIREAVIRRLSQKFSPAAAAATATATAAAAALNATRGDNIDVEQGENSKSQTTSNVKNFSQEVAARAAAEDSAAAVAAQTNLAKAKPKIRPLPSSAPSTSNHSVASKHSASSSSAPTGTAQSTAAGTSTASAALVASSTRSVSEAESLRSILARLNLLQLEVFAPVYELNYLLQPHFLRSRFSLPSLHLLLLSLQPQQL